MRRSLIPLGAAALFLAATATLAADPHPPTDWSHKTAATLAQLGSGLDMAATNPAAAKPILADAESSISSIIEAAPCGRSDLAKLHFNRGLAYSALGEHANALLDFKTADALYPSAAARSQIELQRRSLILSSAGPTTTSDAATKDKPAAPSQPLAEQATRLVRKAPPEIRFWSSIGLLTGFWVVLGLWGFGPKALRRGSTLAGAAALLAFAILGFASLLIDTRHESEVVVLSPDCTPRTGPDAVAYPPASFEGKPTVPRGSELVVLDSRDLAGKPGRAEWLKVVRKRENDTGTTNSGVWVPASAVGWVQVQPPIQAPG